MIKLNIFNLAKQRIMMSLGPELHIKKFFLAERCRECE